MIREVTLRSSDYVLARRLDWPKIFQDLWRCGVSPYTVAAMIGEQWSTVQRWVTGQPEPRHSHAMAIIQLHIRYCGIVTTQARFTEAGMPFYPAGNESPAWQTIPKPQG